VGRPRKRLGQIRGSGAKPQRGLGRQPQDFRPVERFFFTEGSTLMPIFHCGLARVAKKSYRKYTRKSCPLASAPKKRHGGRPIRSGSGGGQTRGGRWRQPLNQGPPRAPPLRWHRLRVGRIADYRPPQTQQPGKLGPKHARQNWPLQNTGPRWPVGLVSMSSFRIWPFDRTHPTWPLCLS
jgi:hypothetical protein